MLSPATTKLTSVAAPKGTHNLLVETEENVSLMTHCVLAVLQRAREGPTLSLLPLGVYEQQMRSHRGKCFVNSRR